MITAQAKIRIHQVEGYVWCDAHSEVHQRSANVYEEDETGRTRCNAEAWRPVFTTDSPAGVL